VDASRGECFGLTLNESARAGLSIFVRDFLVFREIAGDHARYFIGPAINGLANALRISFSDLEHGTYPSSLAIPALSWTESSIQLAAILANKNWYKVWTPKPENI
jgi:hypothetical protein